MGPRIRRGLALAVIVAVAACHRAAPVAEGPGTNPKFPDSTEKDKRPKDFKGEADSEVAVKLFKKKAK